MGKREIRGGAAQHSMLFDLRAPRLGCRARIFFPFRRISFLPVDFSSSLQPRLFPNRTLRAAGPTASRVCTALPRPPWMSRLPP